MSLQLLNENPLYFLIWVLAIVISLTTHEFTHASMAYALGDDTAKRMGRLTLNPLVHIDWLGFLMLIFAGFGWAKPVMFNPHNLRYKKWGPVMVGLAGPLINLVNVIAFGLLLRSLAGPLGLDNLLIQFLNLLVIVNVVLFVFNFLPIPPLDGSHLIDALLISPRWNHLKFTLHTRGPIILIVILLADQFLGLGVFSTLFNFIITFVYKVFSV